MEIQAKKELEELLQSNPELLTLQLKINQILDKCHNQEDRLALSFLLLADSLEQLAIELIILKKML
jgi:hypothetical protein